MTWNVKDRELPRLSKVSYMVVSHIDVLTSITDSRIGGQVDRAIIVRNQDSRDSYS